MAGWHHWLYGRESEWTLGVGDGQGGLACSDSWGHKQSDTTEWLNWTDANILCIYPKLRLQGSQGSHLPQGSASWLRTYLTNQYVILRYCSPNLCKWNYLYGGLPFFKIQVNHLMAQDKPFGAKIIPKCILWVTGLVPIWILSHSFLSLTDC